jgi:hypothetical protein
LFRLFPERINTLLHARRSHFAKFAGKLLVGQDVDFGVPSQGIRELLANAIVVALTVNETYHGAERGRRVIIERYAGIRGFL